MGGETISIQYLKALRGEIVWDMSSILSVDHHRCAMQGMSMGQVLNVQNVIVQETILDNDGKKNQDIKDFIQWSKHDCCPKLVKEISPLNLSSKV